HGGAPRARGAPASGTRAGARSGGFPGGGDERAGQRAAPVAAPGPSRCSQPPMRRLALAIDAEAAGLGHNDEAVMLKLTEPAADAVGGAAHFLRSAQVRQEDAAVVLLPEAPPALEMHIEPARAVRCCAPRGRVHHFEVDGHERREPAFVFVFHAPSECMGRKSAPVNASSMMVWMRSSPRARTSAWAVAISHRRSTVAVLVMMPRRTSSASRQHWRRY